MEFLANIGIGVLQLLYRLAQHRRPRRDKIVFLSRQQDEPSLDFQLLAEHLAGSQPDLEVVVRCRTMGRGLLGALGYLPELLAQVVELATARACVVDGYLIPVSVLDHGDELFVVQAWHALGAIKHFGYQALDRAGGRPGNLARAMRMHRNYDAVLCGGPGSIPHFAAAFDVDPVCVLPLGLPRVDYLRAQDGARLTDVRAPEAITRLVAENPGLADPTRMRVLYAPTFRRNRETPFGDVLAAFAGMPVALIVKPHELDRAALETSDAIDATGCETMDLLVLADAVITDYSAIAFEALAIDRPVYFYVPDADEYSADVGLNIDPRTALSNLAFEDAVELASAVVANRYTGSPADAFAEKFVPARIAHCTNQIADVLRARLGCDR